MELLRDYDTSVLYYPDKSNIVADALSRMSMGSVAHVPDDKKELVNEVNRLSWLGVHLEDSSNEGPMVHITLNHL